MVKNVLISFFSSLKAVTFLSRGCLSYWKDQTKNHCQQKSKKYLHRMLQGLNLYLKPWKSFWSSLLWRWHLVSIWLWPFWFFFFLVHLNCRSFLTLHFLNLLFWLQILQIFLKLGFWDSFGSGKMMNPYFDFFLARFRITFFQTLYRQGLTQYENKFLLGFLFVSFKHFCLIRKGKFNISFY